MGKKTYVNTITKSQLEECDHSNFNNWWVPMLDLLGVYRDAKWVLHQSWAPRRVVCGWIGMYVASKRRRTVKQMCARKKNDGGTSDPKANGWRLG